MCFIGHMGKQKETGFFLFPFHFICKPYLYALLRVQIEHQQHRYPI